jgi:hypothetical protein
MAQHIEISNLEKVRLPNYTNVNISTVFGRGRLLKTCRLWNDPKCDIETTQYIQLVIPEVQLAIVLQKS